MRCESYLARAKDEIDLPTWLATTGSPLTLIVSEGFEERSLGAIETFAQLDRPVSKLVIGQYENSDVPNDRYRRRFEVAAEKIAPQRWKPIPHDNTGAWLEEALNGTTTEDVIVDITGISNRALFQALDAVAASSHKVLLAYSEAQEYHPKESDWRRVEAALAGTRNLSYIVEEQRWLFGPNHDVELVAGHEGYDSPSAGRALVAFLPFKSARLAAVLGEDDYAACRFIAGRPRLSSNSWRLDALKKINENVVKDWPVTDMNTFGYRNALRELSEMLCGENGLLEMYNVHLTILGSKLQDVACWALASMIPSLTIVTSIPHLYFTEAFSEGIGARWIIPIAKPS